MPRRRGFIFFITAALGPACTTKDQAGCIVSQISQPVWRGYFFGVRLANSHARTEAGIALCLPQICFWAQYASCVGERSACGPLAEAAMVSARARYPEFRKFIRYSVRGT